VTFDVRVTPFWNFTFLEELLEGVRTSAGPNVTLEYISNSKVKAQTPLNSGNAWWSAFQEVARKQ
jgi:hypothetical protein